ncbi:hypothetical protein M5K25_018036 [Dendrobium thyrsiflorum]|uniref:Uncharacterized protein n=1 Tax=Dendrobium thyrsiflorum TaxID=117978 RepID=A0ABD0UPG2_DENTH
MTTSTEVRRILGVGKVAGVGGGGGCPRMIQSPARHRHCVVRSTNPALITLPPRPPPPQAIRFPFFFPFPNTGLTSTTIAACSHTFTAPPRTSILTIPTYPSAPAISTAVFPFAVLAIRSAPRFTSISTASACPASTAQCSAVYPSSSLASICAPFASKTLITSIHPLNPAIIKAVHPDPSLTSTAAPISIARDNALTSPLLAAAIRLSSAFIRSKNRRCRSSFATSYAVFPALFLASLSPAHPPAIRSLAITSSPSAAATWSGVSPPAPQASTLAPAEIRISEQSRRFSAMAKCSAVRPSVATASLGLCRRRPPCEEELGNDGLSVSRRSFQRRPPLARCLHVCAEFYEELHQVGATASDGELKKRSALSVGGVGRMPIRIALLQHFSYLLHFAVFYQTREDGGSDIEDAETGVSEYVLLLCIEPAGWDSVECAGSCADADDGVDIEGIVGSRNAVGDERSSRLLRQRNIPFVFVLWIGLDVMFSSYE